MYGPTAPRQPMSLPPAVRTPVSSTTRQPPRCPPSRRGRIATPVAAMMERVQSSPGEEVIMKKVLILALVAAAVFFGVKKARSGRADADLWAEATDSVDR
jgi:hypothetical protein